MVTSENDAFLLTDFIRDYWIVSKGPYLGYINERMGLKIEEEKIEREKATLEKELWKERID